MKAALVLVPWEFCTRLFRLSIRLLIPKTWHVMRLVDSNNLSVPASNSFISLMCLVVSTLDWQQRFILSITAQCRHWCHVQPQHGFCNTIITVTNVLAYWKLTLIFKRRVTNILTALQLHPLTTIFLASKLKLKGWWIPTCFVIFMLLCGLFCWLAS